MAATAALVFSATAAGAVEVINPAVNNSTLVIQNLSPGANLTNNGPFKSNSTAYLFDEGTNPGTGDHTFLLHFDRQGGLLSIGRVRGSFDFTLDPGDLFVDVFADYASLYASDDLSTGVQYQRDGVSPNLLTLVRGLENPNFPIFGDAVHISPNPFVNDSSPTYHVSYDFRNDGLTMDEVRFVFSSGAVPEPATWALMLGGFGLAGAALRRRRAAFA